MTAQRGHYHTDEERKQAQREKRRAREKLIRDLLKEHKDRMAKLPLDPNTGTIYTQEEELLWDEGTRKLFISALLRYHFKELKAEVDAFNIVYMATYALIAKCAHCQQDFVKQHTSQKYCSTVCRDNAAKKRARPQA